MEPEGEKFSCALLHFPKFLRALIASSIISRREYESRLRLVCEHEASGKGWEEGGMVKRENGMTPNLHFDAVELRATSHGGENHECQRGRGS